MGPDQKGAVWSGFIFFTSIVKFSLKCTWIYAADVKAEDMLRAKNIGGISVSLIIWFLGYFAVIMLTIFYIS